MKTDSHLRYLLSVSKLPSGLRRFIAYVAEKFGELRIAATLRNLRKLSVLEYQEKITLLHDARNALVKRMKDEKIDAILCPAGGLPAPLRSLAPRLAPPIAYFFVFNALNMPAGWWFLFVPITTV